MDVITANLDEKRREIAANDNPDLLPVISVLEAADKLTGIARDQANKCYSFDFALDGEMYVSSPKLYAELIAAAPTVGLKLVSRNGAL